MIKQKFQDILKAINHCNVAAIREYEYGWHDKSLGLKVLNSNNEWEWIQISEHDSLTNAEDHNRRLWDSNSLSGIKKPYIHEVGIIETPSKFWSVTRMDCMDKVVCSTPYLIPSSPVPESEWFLFLKRSLLELQENQSVNIAFRQDLINRRISESFPLSNTCITTWKTVHGDLHWANITQKCSFLDWESWGKGPDGIDIAFLYLFSLLNTGAKEKIRDVFAEYFSSPQFKVCLLFGCCELMRMTELYNDHPVLYPHLKALAQIIFKEITI